MRIVIRWLRNSGIRPASQRFAVAEFVLSPAVHPAAYEARMQVRDHCPTNSRATVHNTLKLFAGKRLRKFCPLGEAAVVFCPRVKPLCHFICADVRKVIGVSRGALRVRGEQSREEFGARECQVVMHDRRRR